MSGLIIREDKCIGCGKCIRSCPQGGLIMENRIAHATENCTLCGICVEACPKQAIRLERNAEGKEKLRTGEWKDIWVFAQVLEGELLPVSLELTGKGRALADERGCRLTALLPGDASGRSGDDLIAAGADEWIGCRDPRLAGNPADLLADWTCRLIRKARPEIVLFGATALGRELAPRVAVRLRTGLTADCTELSIDPESGLLRQTRPAFGGNLMATILCPDHRPQMATVRAGVFPVPEPDPGRKGGMKWEPLEEEGVSAVRILKKVLSDNTDSIAKAEVIVDVGRGIGSRKNLPLMQEFARRIGGRLGCSRPLVEMGWCEYPHQIGQTGSAVSPKILICVGVSGAIQHLAGIGGAETIIAINNDPKAPIFGVSDYAVVGDCVEIVRELIGRGDGSPG